jgi:hypothetical protein
MASRESFNDKFNFFSNGFLALVGMGLSLYAIYIVRGDNMIPPIAIWAFLGLAGVFALLSIYSGIKMIMTPKDTRLDDLIKTVNDLKWDKNNVSNNKVNLELKIDATDISKMIPEQQETIIKIINNLKDK